jgi:hypothetical protein
MDRQMRVLKETVEERCGCACRHAGSAHVRELGAEGLMWEGEVQTFELIGHGHATQCYAFIVQQAGRPMRRVTALSPPIKSAEWAVRVFLMRERIAVGAGQ